jgi:hypothetical protein
MFTELVEGTLGAPADEAQRPLYICGCPLCSGSAGNSPAELERLQFGILPDQPANGANMPLAASAAELGALMSGSQWAATGAKTVITFSFANTASIFSGGSASYSGSLQEFSAQDKALTRTLLGTIEAVCNVSFVEVADNASASGQVRYAYSQAPNDMGYAGFAFFPSSTATGGDVWIGSAQSSAQWDFYRPDLILHETLHAIGLKHPFEGAAVLNKQTDIIPNTVMSYSAMAGSASGALSSYPAEPMVLDVAALQAMYGAAAHNAADTLYNLSDPSFQAGFRALWDSAGNDTLDASAIGRGVTLDLHGGARSDIGVQVGASAYFGTGEARILSTTTYTSTLGISSGTIIENATGSAFNDVLIGNDFDNILSGGGGNDLIDGGLGNDRLYGGNGDDAFFVAGGGKTLDGGAGADKAVFAGSINNYAISQGLDSYAVRSLLEPGAVTTLYGVERLEFSDLSLDQRPSTHAPIQVESLYGQAFRLYQAALDRLPDQEGLIYQTKALEGGLSLTQLASNFMASPEFGHRFNVPGNKEFVTLLYNNVLDRAPEAEGLAYHMARLEQQGASRADILIGFSESPENQALAAAALVGVGMAGMLYPV